MCVCVYDSGTAVYSVGLVEVGGGIGLEGEYEDGKTRFEKCNRTRRQVQDIGKR